MPARPLSEFATYAGPAQPCEHQESTRRHAVAIIKTLTSYYVHVYHTTSNRHVSYVRVWVRMYVVCLLQLCGCVAAIVAHRHERTHRVMRTCGAWIDPIVCYRICPLLYGSKTVRRQLITRKPNIKNRTLNPASVTCIHPANNQF